MKVRWTGHLFAISISFAFFSSSIVPSSAMCRANRSRGRSPSGPLTIEWATSTEKGGSVQPLRSA
jgi:hypothetical protein